MADKGIWTNSFKVTTQYSKGSIFGLHSGFVRTRPCSVLLMIIQGDAVVTRTNVYFNRCLATAQHRSALRTAKYPCLHLWVCGGTVDTPVLGTGAREGVWVRVPPGPHNKPK